LTGKLVGRFTPFAQFEVIARTTYELREKSVSVGEISSELIDSAIEGGVRKPGNNVRIADQPINCNNEAHLSSSCFDGELSDIFAVRAEIGEPRRVVYDKLSNISSVSSR
jgi:TolB-like protein